MTPERINTIIAESQGWRFARKEGDNIYYLPPTTGIALHSIYQDDNPHIPDYYNSRDALQPVLDGLTEEQKGVVAILLDDPTLSLRDALKDANSGWISNTPVYHFKKFIAIPNSTLAIAVVKALGKWEES